MEAIVLRCKDPRCRCSKRGKLLAKVYNLPESIRGRDVFVEVPCPKNKSKSVRLKIG